MSKLILVQIKSSQHLSVLAQDDPVLKGLNNYTSIRSRLLKNMNINYETIQRILILQESSINKGSRNQKAHVLHTRVPNYGDNEYVYNSLSYSSLLILSFKLSYVDREKWDIGKGRENQESDSLFAIQGSLFVSAPTLSSLIVSRTDHKIFPLLPPPTLSPVTLFKLR